MSADWKSEILRDFASWLVDLPPDGEPPMAPPARRSLSDLFSAVAKLGREVALQNRASKQAVVGLEATNAELSRMGTSLGAQRSALQALISKSEPGGGRSPRELAVGFLEIRDSLIRSYVMVTQAEKAIRAGNPAEDRVQPVPEADVQPPTEPRARDDIHSRPPEDRPAPAEARTQGDVDSKAQEDDPVPAEQQVQADDSAESRETRPAPAVPHSHDGLQHASRVDGPPVAETQTQGDAVGESQEDNSAPAERQAQADDSVESLAERSSPADPHSHDGLQQASREDGPAAAEQQCDVAGRVGEGDSLPLQQQVRGNDSVESREDEPPPAEGPNPETEEIEQHREIVADIAGTLEVVVRKFDSILRSQGIVAVETIGRPFDPTVMSVVGTRDVPGVPSGFVVEEVRGGFLMGRRVLRSAEVFVNRIHENRRGGE